MSQAQLKSTHPWSSSIGPSPLSNFQVTASPSASFFSTPSFEGSLRRNAMRSPKALPARSSPLTPCTGEIRPARHDDDEEEEDEEEWVGSVLPLLPPSGRPDFLFFLELGDLDLDQLTHAGRRISDGSARCGVVGGEKEVVLVERGVKRPAAAPPVELSGVS